MMNSLIQSKKSFQNLLFWSCLFLILGTAVKNIWYYPSYFDLLYLNDSLGNYFFSTVEGDPSLFIESFNSKISKLIIGSLLLGVVFGFRNNRLSRVFLALAWACFLINFLAEWNQVNFRLAFLLENFIRLILVPLFLVRNINSHKLYNLLFGAMVLTFAGHGLFALNIFPRPGYYVDMVVKALSIGEQEASLFLQVIGILDLGLLVSIFIKPIQKWAILYMIVWGFLTTIARPVINISWMFIADSLIIWIPELFIRMAHFFIPIGLYWELKKNENY